MLIACHLMVAWGLRRAEGTGDDLDRYWQIGSVAEPYVSQPLEVAPMATQFFRLLANVTGDRGRFRVAMVRIVAVADLLIAFLIGRAFGWGAAAVYLALTLPLLPLYFRRFDLLPTAAATIGMAAHRWARPLLGAASLAIGASLKLWPLPLMAFIFGSTDRPARRKVAQALAVTLMLLGGGWILLGGLPSVGHVVTFRGATGWHIESLVGAFIAVWDSSTLRIESDAWRLGYTTPVMTIVLLSLGTMASFWVSWQGAIRKRPLGATWLGSVTALLVFSPLLSPQFMAWLAPATAIAWSEGSRRPAVLAGAAAAFTFLLMRAYGAILAGELGGLLLVMIRNSLLLLACADAMRIVLSTGNSAAAERA